MTAADPPTGVPADNAHPAPRVPLPRGEDRQPLEHCGAVADELHRLTAAVRRLESRVAAISEQIAELQGRPDEGAAVPTPVHGIIVP